MLGRKSAKWLDTSEISQELLLELYLPLLPDSEVVLQNICFRQERRLVFPQHYVHCSFVPNSPSLEPFCMFFSRCIFQPSHPGVKRNQGKWCWMKGQTPESLHARWSWVWHSAPDIVELEKRSAIVSGPIQVPRSLYLNYLFICHVRTQSVMNSPVRQKHSGFVFVSFGQ